jgi:hypothetical protein
MVENPETEEAWPEERDRYIHTAEQMTWNRTMFISVEGRNGLAPQIVQPGDVICILLGISVPVVLRVQGCGSYSFIGDANLHGLMDGEDMKDLASGLYSLEELQLDGISNGMPSDSDPSRPLRVLEEDDGDSEIRSNLSADLSGPFSKSLPSSVSSVEEFMSAADEFVILLTSDKEMYSLCRSSLSRLRLVRFKQDISRLLTKSRDLREEATKLAELAAVKAVRIRAAYVALCIRRKLDPLGEMTNLS